MRLLESICYYLLATLGGHLVLAAANCMKTLAQFANKGLTATHKVVSLIKVQQGHKSKTVVRTVDKLLAELTV